MDDQNYPGTVKSLQDGCHNIIYDDRDIEELKLVNENWRQIDSLNSASVYASPKLESNEQDVLKQMLESIGKKQFMRHQL